MAFVSQYTFDNISRIGNDNSSVEQNTLQSMEYCNYMLQNYFANDCSMKNPIELATSQPCINYKGGFNVGAGGCNINDNSNLLIGTIQPHPKCRIDLFHRPFATVPYLGRGSVDPVIEAQIQQGESVTNRRSITRMGEKSYINYHNTPLQTYIKNKIINHSNAIDIVASSASGWTHGGIASREVNRDQKSYTS